MKNVLFLLAILAIGFTSCKKDEILPYQEVPEGTTDTTTWNGGYQDGGTLPGGGGQITNDLIGTQWVITNVQTSFSSQTPNDTLYFVDNNTYTINSGAVKTYQLSFIPNSNMLELRLDYCFPIGSGIWVAQLSNTFMDDGIVYDGLFTNQFNSNDEDRLVTMHKL